MPSPPILRTWVICVDVVYPIPTPAMRHIRSHTKFSARRGSARIGQSRLEFAWLTYWVGMRQTREIRTFGDHGCTGTTPVQNQYFPLIIMNGKSSTLSRRRACQ